MENYFERLLENTQEELLIGVQKINENEKGKLSPEKKSCH